MKMEEWKECKLGDICNISSSKRIFAEEYVSSGIPFYRGKEIIEKHNKNAVSSELFITHERFAEIKSKFPVPQIDDILLTSVGTLGIPWLVNESNFYFKDGNLTWFRSNTEKVNPKFLYYWFESNYAKNQIDSMCIGSTQKALTIDTLSKFSINLPPLPTQQKIARILSSLDHKIELNNKINTNLEQQAGALFKNWFVDFEPFGGKMLEGWKEADIYSIANIIYGSPFASKLFNTEKNGKPIIRIRDLKDQHSDVYTPEERDDAYLIQPKDIVVGMDGEFRPYIWGSEPGWLNQRVCVFENKRPKGKAFLYFSIKPLLDVVEKTQVATTVIHIGKKDFDKFQIILPTEDILDRFDELTDPLFNQIVANRLENQRLAELRDTLLPRLMNGELKI